jgi:hypothetical protein
MMVAGRERVAWGGIWAGMLIVLGSLLLLTALGVAVGISTVNPGQTDAGAFGTGAGIWGMLSAAAALFAGGMVSTRLGATRDRTTSFIQGALVWLLSLIVMAYLATSGIRMIASGALSLAGTATESISTVAASRSADVDLSGTVDDVAARIRDPRTAERMASLTGLSLSEVQLQLEETAQNVESSSDPQQAAREAQQGLSSLMERAQETGSLGRQVERQAEEVQPEAAAAAWGTFGALLLSLMAAVVGAMAGTRRRAVVRTETPAAI